MPDRYTINVPRSSRDTVLTLWLPFPVPIPYITILCSDPPLSRHQPPVNHLLPPVLYLPAHPPTTLEHIFQPAVHCPTFQSKFHLQTVRPSPYLSWNISLVVKSREIGCKILESMAGKPVEEFTFRKADQAGTPASRSTVRIKGETVVVNPQLLFQQLVAVRDRCEDLPSLFKHELCSHPPALFESSYLPPTGKQGNSCRCPLEIY